MTDSTLPAASFSTAATWNGLRTHIVSVLECKRYAVGTIVTEATTGGVEVVLSLLHAAIIAAAATTPTSTRFMHCSLQLLCRAPVIPPEQHIARGGRAGPQETPAAALLQAPQQPARAHGSLPRLIHLRPDLRRPLHQKCGARLRSGRGAVGWVARAAPRVTRAATKLQHAELLRGDRHLVRRQRLEVVDPPLVIEGSTVRAHELHVLLVLQLLQQIGVPRCGGREATARVPQTIGTDASVIDERGREGEVGGSANERFRPNQIVLRREHHRGVSRPRAFALGIVPARGQAVIPDLSHGTLVPGAPRLVSN